MIENTSINMFKHKIIKSFKLTTPETRQFFIKIQRLREFFLI